MGMGINHAKNLAVGKVPNAEITAVCSMDPPLTIEAFKLRLHVLIEKPAGAYTKQVNEMNKAAAASDKVFSIMFQMRTNPIQRRIKSLELSNAMLLSTWRDCWTNLPMNENVFHKELSERAGR